MAGETIAGVPLGLSRDLALLPMTGSSWRVPCHLCHLTFEAFWRRVPDGRLAIPQFCEDCRERKRTQWIAENVPVMPTARVRQPGWLRRLFG